MSLARAARIWAALAGLVFVANRSVAHLKFPELSAERAIELRLDQQPIRIGYRLSFGPDLAEAERHQADRDRTGEVSQIEGNARLDQRTRELIGALRICTGMTLDELECRAPSLQQVERVEAQGWVREPPGDLHLSWTLKLDQSAEKIGALRFEDATDLEGVAITDVRVVAAEAHPLSLSADGRSPSGVASEFTWNEAARPAGPRVVVAAWPAPASSRSALIGAIAVAGAGLFLLVLWRRAALT